MMDLYSALLCIVVHPKCFTIIWGGVSPQPLPVCSIHSSISHSPSIMLLCTVTHRTMSTTRLNRYYRGKTNSYRGENFYRYIANNKILSIPSLYLPHTYEQNCTRALNSASHEETRFTTKYELDQNKQVH